MSDANHDTPDPAVLERLLLGPTCLFDGVCNLCNGSVRFILATGQIYVQPSGSGEYSL